MSRIQTENVRKPWEVGLQKYSTQATTVLAVIVGVTGVLMFFHIGRGMIGDLHEWLGMVFVIAAIAHVVRHRHSFLSMLTQPRLKALAGVGLVVVAVFLAALPAKQGNPLRTAATAMMKAPLQDVAPVLGVPVETLTTRLAGAGLTAAPSQSIAVIAAQQGMDPTRALDLALGGQQNK